MDNIKTSTNSSRPSIGFARINFYEKPIDSAGSSIAFTEALSKIASMPRAEIQKRLAESPKESVSRHKRYKYVPAERPAKP